MVCGTYRLLPMVFGSRSVYKSHLYTCEPDDLTKKKFQIYTYITIVGFILVPMLLTVISNIKLFMMASKIQSRLSNRMIPSRTAIIAVMALSWLFIISFLPIS